MFVITCSPEGYLDDWHAGVRITPEGAEVIPQLTRSHGPCPTCGRRQTELRGGICLRCFIEGPDHGEDE